MINQATIQKIMDTAQIDEVVSDFITLKKAGANYKALSPFTNEKTPSFFVSPTKNIFKCFSTGKGGNAVTFVMEHEGFSYPEALRWIAKKYNIEIEEGQQTSEEKEAKSHIESLHIVNEYAQKQFTNCLIQQEEGQTIGLTYLKERGFQENTIEKFQLGYCPSGYAEFTQQAIKDGYKLDLLKELGLTTAKENDFFRERVIFPIQNLSGKVIAFGARTLKKDKKIPKYLNSPESKIYNKSQVLYGIYFAKKDIRLQDNCLLVEGYTDVISLHQAGIENVVASSGTALTKEQVRLIKRYTQNLTILYDGDAAGMKAALRGIELVLEADLNLNVIALPENEDPDSYLQKVGSDAFKEYVQQNSKDFILFKTDLLLEEASGSPAKKAALVTDIVQTIVKISDPIKRSLYIRECSSLLSVDERLLINELNKLIRQQLTKNGEATTEEKEDLAKLTTETKDHSAKTEPTTVDELQEPQERSVVRILLEYGNKEYEENTVMQFVLAAIEGAVIHNELYLSMLDKMKAQFESDQSFLDKEYFLNYGTEAEKDLVLEIMAFPYEISLNWDKMHDIIVPEPEMNYKKDVRSTLLRFKLKKLDALIEENKLRLKKLEPEADFGNILKVHNHLLQTRKDLSDEMGMVVG